LHGERRIWEVWGVRFEDEEDGWDWFDLEGGEVGVVMAGDLLVGGEDDGFDCFEERVLGGEKKEEVEEEEEERAEDKGKEKRQGEETVEMAEEVAKEEAEEEDA
jgi:hypothetical protein